MRVVDTSAWIESFIEGKRNPAIRRELPPRDQCIVPTIVQFELGKWTALNLHDDDAAAAMAYITHCIVVDLDTSIALRAARLSIETKLAMADAIIYATALHVGADILTCDAHFRGLDQVVYFPNTKN